jgi:long-chain acyl-CoA synthetase
VSDPLALLSLAVAAGGGRVGGFEVSQLVAAGFTLKQRSAALIRALAGRRAAILLPTSPQYVIALAASEGHAAVLVNPLAAPGEIAHQLSDAGVGAVFTTSALAPRLPASITRVLVDDAPRSARVLHDGASRDVDLGSHVGLDITGEIDVVGRDEEAAIVYTSAMAGRSLGAILTHRNLIANARAAVDALAMDTETRVLALLPLSHLFGLTVTGTAPLMAGGQVQTLSRFAPGRALELLASSRATVFVGVPAIYRTLLGVLEGGGSPDEARAAFAGVRVCVCGGAELPVEVQDRWYDATGVALRQGYGLTEAAPVCLFNRVDRPNVRGTLGVEFPGVEVSVREPIAFGDDGCPRPSSGASAVLPDGTEGEICVRGDNVYRGYVSREDAGLVVRDGWLHTGDLGRRNADGTVSFRGLVKPMFTRNGFNVYPHELERVVGRLPGVERVTIEPIPEPAREHDIRMIIHGSVTEPDVRRWCQEQLAAYKQPSEIVIAASR